LGAQNSTYSSDFGKELRKRDSAMKGGKTTEYDAEVEEAKRKFLALKEARG